MIELAILLVFGAIVFAVLGFCWRDQGVMEARIAALRGDQAIMDVGFTPSRESMGSRIFMPLADGLAGGRDDLHPEARQSRTRRLPAGSVVRALEDASSRGAEVDGRGMRGIELHRVDVGVLAQLFVIVDFVVDKCRHWATRFGLGPAARVANGNDPAEPELVGHYE